MPREARIIAKRRNENLRRRIETLLIKAHEIWDIYGVDVAMVLKNNNQYYTYRSTDRPTWPPTMVEIETAYPPPKNLRPEDLEAKAAKRKPLVQPYKRQGELGVGLLRSGLDALVTTMITIAITSIITTTLPITIITLISIVIAITNAPQYNK